MTRKPIFAAPALFPGHAEPKPLRKKCRVPRATVAPPPTVLANLLWKIGADSPLSDSTDRPSDWWASKPFSDPADRSQAALRQIPIRLTHRPITAGANCRPGLSQL
jgi:hypothetical protein